MTAKEYLKQFKVHDKVIWVMDNGDKKVDFCISDMMEEYANKKTRHIAEQAVAKRIEFYTELMEEETDEDGQEDQIMIWTAKIFAVKDILTRINELTQGE